jgi:hypothetical protein
VFCAEPFTRVFVFVRECVGDLLFQGVSKGHYLAMGMLLILQQLPPFPAFTNAFVIQRH